MAGTRKKSRSASKRGSGYGGYGAPKSTGVAEEVVNDDADELPVLTDTPRPVAKRRFSRRNILLGVLGFVLLVIGGVALWAYITIQRTLPTLNGTVSFPGLSAPVTVTRDNYGVPHLVAANIEDLYAAQGYVHAQDRLFQMFQLRTVGQGRLSELLSPSYVDDDRALRTLGFRRAADAELPTLAPKVRAGLDAYARGVNAFLRTHGDSLPLEFVLAGATMEEWQPVDSVAFGKLQAWDLTDTWDNDLALTDLVAKLGSERASQLVPPYPGDSPTITVDPAVKIGGASALLGEYRSRLSPLFANFGVPDLGSNNWVLAGSKTTTGQPLLANDPHLSATNPSPWYQVHLATTDGAIDVVGFGFPGAPGVVTGHNKDIAWGVTNTGADVQDVFIEKLDPVAQPGRYLSGDEWVPLELLTETIKVKGGVPVTHTVRLTNHGPIITDAFLASDVATPTMPYGTSITDVVSIQWTAAEPGRLLESVYDLQTVSNWDEFRSALQKWDAPGQNFVYADREGNIGYQMTGKMPTRKAGDGSVAVPGWTGEYDWTGNIPFAELPSAYNPPSGYVATANHKPFGPGSTTDIPGHWSYPWRIERITEMIEAKDKLDISDVQSMLSDTRSALAAKWAPVLVGLTPTDPKEQSIVKLFEGWDGNITAESAPAAAYQFIIRQALTETFADDLGQQLFGEYIFTSGSGHRALELLLGSPNDPFWDRTETPAKENRDALLLRALASARGDLDVVHGENMANWQWGKAHQVLPPHPFGTQPVVGGMFNLAPQPLGGDGTTVAVASYDAFGRSFVVKNHQSYRMIIDVGDWNNSLSIYATGQSGQPFAKHWGDLYDKWRRFEYNPLLYAEDRIGEQRGGVLILQP